MPRVLLLLPTATYRAADFVQAAGALGVEVVVASEHRQAMAASMDDRAVVVPLGDPAAAVAAIEALHRRTPIDAVVAVDDQGVVVAALAGERLGLLHNPPAAAAATRHKLTMRQRLEEAGIAQPRWRALPGTGDAAALAAEIGFPCVLKPLSLSASRGVIRADDGPAALAAAARIRDILAEAGEDAAGTLLVESFVPGDEVAVEGLLEGGRLTVLAVFDKPDPLDGPYFEETLYITPSRLDPAARGAVEALTGDAVAALGLREGPIHAELRLGAAGPVILEVAARTIGGLCARSLRFGVGVSLEELVLRHALGWGAGDLARQEGASGVMMLPIPAAGVLARVDGRAEAGAVPGVVGIEISVQPGRPVRPLPEGDRYLGFLFARADTPAQVEQALREAHRRLDVVIVPAPA